MTNSKEWEMVFWSIAFPGFGQLLSGQFLKGLLFITLEFLINVQSHLNQVIIFSFQGKIEQAISQTNYQWLMFYPCIYLFAIWDAYRYVGKKESFAFLPFVFSAYMGTIGVIYSSNFKFLGVLLGPIWLSILCLLLGFMIGLIFRNLINNHLHKPLQE